MKTLKFSRQRESIKSCLMARNDHPTADAIYASIREEFPNISLGTVYRNLNLLVDLGEVRRLRCDNGPDHFDGDTSPHYHFICRKCGRVMDMPMSHMDELNVLADRYCPGQIEDHTMLFYGRCSSCKEEENFRKSS